MGAPCSPDGREEGSQEGIHLGRVPRAVSSYWGTDCAESPPREIIDLTDDSEDDILDLSSEEERQAREEERRGVLTFHAEVERARADPAPEYKAPPPEYNALGPSRS